MERQNRLLTILSVVFLLLIVVVVLGKDDRKRTPGEDGAPARHDLFPYESADVTGVTITTGGKDLTFTRENGKWVLAGSDSITIDDRRVSELVDRFASLEVEERTIAGKPEDLGLDDDHAVQVAFTTASQTHRVWLGKDTTVGYATYLKEAADGPIQLASSKVGDLVRRGVDDFRSKEVWSISSATARRIRIEAGGRSVVLRRDTHGWWLGDEGPRADKDTIDEWLRDAQSVRSAGFLDDQTPASAGLDSPAARIEVEDEAGTSTLRFGPPEDDGAIAATDHGVVRVGTDAMDLVRLDGWESKQLIPVRRYQIDRLEVRLGDRSIALTRAEGKWSDADGNPSALGDALLQKLEDAPADHARTGLPARQGEYGRILLAEGADRTETVVIGQELGDGTRVATDAAGGPPFAVTQAALDSIASGLPEAAGAP